jgi:hypothetical protein
MMANLNIYPNPSFAVEWQVEDANGKIIHSDDPSLFWTDLTITDQNLNAYPHTRFWTTGSHFSSQILKEQLVDDSAAPEHQYFSLPFYFDDLPNAAFILLVHLEGTYYTGDPNDSPRDQSKFSNFSTSTPWSITVHSPNIIPPTTASANMNAVRFLFTSMMQIFLTSKI